MKLNALHASFAFSIFFHAAVVSAVVLVGSRLTPLPPPPPEEISTLILVAAPEEATPLTTPVVAVIPPPVQPEPLPVKMVEPPPPEKIPEPAVTEIVKPVPIIPSSAPTTTLPKKISGDGSSPKPGADVTTTPARPQIEAQPDYLKNPEPPYPPAARRRHQQGMVLLAVTVTPQGRAARVEIKKSSGFLLLDSAAQEAVRDWEFTPHRIGALAIESEIEVPVRFQMKE